MFVLTNAWRAVMQYRAYSILTALVALVISFTSIVSLAILNENTDAHGADYEAQSTTAVIRPSSKLQSKFKGDDAASTTSHYLSIDDYTPFATAAQNKQVSYDYTIIETLPVRQSNVIKAIPGTDDQNADKTGGELLLRSLYDAEAIKTNDLGTFNVIKGKSLKYTDTSATGALISKTLAKENQLKVGSTFTVGNPTDASITYDFTVRGIYEYTDNAGQNTPKLAKDNRDNVIYTAYATTYTYGLSQQEDTESTENTWATPQLDVVFSLSSPSDYEKFVKLVKKAGLPKGYEISSPSLTSYNLSIEPLEHAAGVTRIALWTLWTIGGLMLLALTVARAWLARNKEIAMGLIVGVTRPRLGWQFMLETFILTIAPTAIGLLAGGFSASAIGSALADGHATPVASGVVWNTIWGALGAIAVLAIVAMLRPATFRAHNLFKPAVHTTEVEA